MVNNDLPGLWTEVGDKYCQHSLVVIAGALINIEEKVVILQRTQDTIGDGLC